MWKLPNTLITIVNMTKLFLLDFWQVWLDIEAERCVWLQFYLKSFCVVDIKNVAFWSLTKILTKNLTYDEVVFNPKQVLGYHMRR